MRDLLITIDGPAGAGKTTVSRMLAAKLGYTYVDTGALYRAVALEIKSRGFLDADDEEIKKVLSEIELRFVDKEGINRLYANGRDVTDLIRSSEISMIASAISARPVVREHLLSIQREMGREKRAVFEGRDMGTVVFPDADVKFFLTASIKERAKRRFLETPGLDQADIARVEEEIRKRDLNDQSRRIAPLKPAGDAIIVDSTGIDVKRVVKIMESHIKSLLLEKADVSGPPS